MPGIVEPASTPADSESDTPYLGWRAERRPRAGFAHLLGAAAGAFAVIATIAFVSAIDNDDPQVPGIVLSLVMLGVALSIGAFGVGPLRSAATTMAVGAVPSLWFFALVGDGPADLGRGDLRAFLLLSLASFAALYLLGWTRGRAVFLALALVLLVSWVAFEVAGSGNTSWFGYSTSGSARVSGAGSTAPFTNLNDNSDATRAVVMVLGLAMLCAGAMLDRAKRAGMATPFLVVGAISAVVGGVSLAAEESVFLGGLVAVLIGAAIGVIGAAGHQRRGTPWLGIVILFGGGVAILSDLAPDDAGGVGAIALVFAVALGVIAFFLAPLLGEPDDGDSGDPVDPAMSPVGSDPTG